jgi:anti-sigma regulatory factor (Ser/Thr protein kinase)
LTFGALGVLSVDLPPEPASATRARVLTRECLQASCSFDTLDTVSLLVTELVTNVILHARTPMQLTVESSSEHVRICVEDTSTDRPEPQRNGDGALAGRGLVLVERLASSWGVEATPLGKVVWCEVPV